MNHQPYEPKRLYRGDDSIVFGVCGGIAEYYDLPPFGVRLIWVLLSLTGALFLPMLLAYIVLAVMLKPRPVGPPPVPGDPFYGSGRLSHSEMLGRLQQRFEALDKRLQRMESVVTRPDFGLEEKYREL